MIKTIKIDLNASEPNLPLARSCVYASSAASFTLLNVPRAVGKRQITGVSLVCTNPSNVTVSRAAVRVGSAWEVTIPAAHLSAVGTVSSGVRIVAAGKDENGDAASWVLGVGSLVILDPQGSVTPGTSKHAVNREDFAAIDPETVDIYTLASILKGSTNA